MPLNKQQLITGMYLKYLCVGGKAIPIGLYNRFLLLKSVVQENNNFFLSNLRDEQTLNTHKHIHWG